MKESRYNFIFENKWGGEEEYIAYNSMSNALAIVNKTQYEMYQNFIQRKIEIEDDDFLNDLVKGHFLIDDDVDERENLKFKMYKSRFNTDFLGLTIAPTSDCNFRCTYCYEKDSVKHPPMSEEVQMAIVEFIKARVKYIKTLRVTWYGGEPLLCFDIIKALSEQIIQICEKNDVKYQAGIITNGYMLTPNICKEFLKLKINFIQITMDGTKEFHDARRPLRNGGGTFNKILSNLKEIKGKLPYKISLRINTDRQNSAYINDLMNIFEKEQLFDVVSPYLAMVSTTNDCYSCSECYTPDSFAPIYYEFEATKKNGNIMNKYPVLKSNYCGADMINAFVVDADGRLYKCWNDIGFHERSIASLIKTEDLANTSIVKKYMIYDPTEDSECKDCKLLPICMGGCHQLRLQNLNRCCYMKSYLEKFMERAVQELKECK